MIKASRLPKEYTEVEYIQSSGTQYIDTGYVPTANTKMDFSFKLLENTTQWSCILGSRSGSNSMYCLYINGTKLASNYGSTDTATYSNVFIDTENIYNVKNDEYNFYVNNNLESTISAPGVTFTGATKPIYLFANNNYGELQNRGIKSRVYNLKFYENNTLMRNYVPCKNASNEVGLYDLVTKTFFSNSGTGTFTAGNKVQVKVKKIKAKINETIKNIYYITKKVNNVMVKVFSALSVKGTGENITLDGTANLKFIQPPLPRGNSNQDTSILPTGYTQLDYIESTGTQYINTDLALFNTSDHEIIIDFEPTQFYNYNSIWGSTYDADTFEAWVYGTGALAMRYNYSRYGSDNTISVNSRYLIKVKKENTALSKIVNNTLIGTGTGSTKITDAKFLLFVSGSDYGKYKLYSCKLYRDNILVRNYVPCKNASDEVGLYDLVSKTFFGNSGTGTFTAGNTVTVPNPDFEVHISNVTGDAEVVGGNGIKILNMEKYAIENSTYFTYSSDTGLTAIAKDNRATANVGYPMTVTAGTTYYVKADTDKRILVSQYNSNNGWILNNEVYNGDYFVANNNASYIRVKIADTLTTFPTIIGNVYITTSNDYKEQTYTFPLGTQRMFEGDYLADDGIHHVRKQIELNGTETWGSSGGVFYTTSITDYAISNNIPYSNYFIGYSNVDGSTSAYNQGDFKVGFINVSGLTTPRLYFRNDSILSATNFKTWLGTHNTIIEYELATEEIIPYTTEQQTAYDEIKQAFSYDEQTNISGTSDEANPIFSIEAYQRN